MKRAFWLTLLVSLMALSLIGCQAEPKPQNTIPVLTARFKYRGNMIWLYRDANDKVQMLRGNTRDISAVTRGNKEVFTAGKGEWTLVENITKDQLVYVKNQLFEAGQKKQLVSQPDYVLSVELETLRANIPQVTTEEELAALQAEFQSELLVDKPPLVTITTDTGAKIILELDPEIATNTVNNFVYLIQQKFYDDTIFHRIIPGFMIQGGDPLGTGGGGPGYSIPGEFSLNGFSNSLLHTRGIVSMARGDAPNTAGSQFFIMVADTPGLDGKYAAFGKVLSGMEEVDRIVNLPRDEETDRPNNPPTMKQVTVETFGATYPPPFVMANK